MSSRHGLFALTGETENQPWESLVGVWRLAFIKALRKRSRRLNAPPYTPVIVARKEIAVDVEIVTIITSAAVGAVVAAGINFVNQLLERRARRKELLLSKAIELACDRTRVALEAAKEYKTDLKLGDAAVHAVEYYRMLEHLWDTGVLPPEVEAKLKE
jgi:hypothetical protein